MHNTRYRPDTYGFYTYSGASAAGKLTNFVGPAEVSSDFMDGHLILVWVLTWVKPAASSTTTNNCDDIAMQVIYPQQHQTLIL